MNRSNKCRFELVVYLLMMQVVTSSSHDTGSRAKNILSKLEASFKQQEEYSQSLEAQQYSMIQFTGEDMRFEKIYGLCKSIFAENNPNEVITTITIRNVYAYEPYDEEDYILKFAKAIDDYVKGSKEEFVFDSLFVSVNCIRQSHIKDFDYFDCALSQLYDDLKVVNTLMMENFFEICLDILKEMICSSIDEELKKFESCKSIKSAVQDLEEFSQKMQDKLCCALGNHVANGLACFDKDWRYEGAHYHFDTISKKICSDYKTKKFKRSENKQVWRYFYVYIITVRYNELFRQGIIDLITEYLDVKNSEKTKTSFLKIMTLLRPKLFHGSKNKSDEHYKHVYGRYIDWLSYTRLPVYIYKHLCDLMLDDIKSSHINVFKSATNVICQNINSESTTRIVLQGKLTSDKIYFLCNILKNKTKVRAKCNQQVIYIDDQKILTKDKAKRIFSKCDEIEYNVSNGIKAINMFALFKLTDSNECTEFYKMTYQRNDIENVKEGQIVYTNAFVKSKKIHISVSRSDTSSTEVTNVHKVLKTGLEKDEGTIAEICLVCFESQHRSTEIHIARHLSKDNGKEMLSLLYNLTLAGNTHTNPDTSVSKSHMIFMHNVPMSFVGNIIYALQVLPLAKKPHFTIPNFASINHHNWIYDEFVKTDEQIIDKNGLYASLLNVPISKIVGYINDEDHEFLEIEQFVKNLWLTKFEFKQMLKSIVLQKYYRYAKSTPSDFIDNFYMPDSISLYSIKSEHGSFTLQIHIHKETVLIHNLSMNPMKEIVDIIESKESEKFKKLDGIMLIMGKKSSFIAWIISYVFKRVLNHKKADFINTIGIEDIDFQKMIIECIKELKYECVRVKNITKYGFSRDSMLETLRSIDCNDTCELAKMIVQKMKTILKKRVTKVISITTKKSNNLDAFRSDNVTPNDIDEELGGIDYFKWQD